MDTKITIKPDSPERPKLNSDYSFLSEDFKTPSDLPSACFTPSTMNTPSDAASSLQYCDSPSMISFLKHEQSCLAPNVVKGNFNPEFSDSIPLRGTLKENLGFFSF